MLLPYDVIAQVVSHAQEPVLHSLCLTSHCVHHLASRELYRTLDFDRRDMRPVQCLQSIKDSPHLGIMVTSLRLRLFRDFPAILPLFVSALKLMPALRKLHILDVASIVKAYPEVAEVIAGLTELTEFSFRLNATTTEIMTPLLMRLGRMTLVHARTASPLNERHLGVEHLLRVSADTLEELVLYNFPLVDYLRAQPHLRFSRATRLDLNSHCTSWGPEIARAFPHLRQITLNASVIQPLELLEDARNFPQLDFANVRIDRVRIRAQQHATRRNLPHVVLYSTTPTSSLIPDVLGFFGLLQCERLRSIRIPLFVHSNDALAVLLEVCSLCPNLQCVCAPLAHHSSLVRTCPTLCSFHSHRDRFLSLCASSGHIHYSVCASSPCHGTTQRTRIPYRSRLSPNAWTNSVLYCRLFQCLSFD